MEENSENKNEIKDCDCSHDKWIKFGLIVIAVFLGCYLATYYLLDQMRHSYYMPVRPIHNIDNVIEEQDRIFDDMDEMPLDLNAMIPMSASVVQTFKKDDAYIVVVDLKPFNGESSKIKTQVTPNRISIQGEKFTSKKHTQSDYNFSQSFVFPEKINVKGVTKEKIKGKLVIILPIVDY